MISLHRSMHSSQMYTPGPAISLRTCFCDLPQNAALQQLPCLPELGHGTSSLGISATLWNVCPKV